MKDINGNQMHSDQYAIYEMFFEFQQINEGIEVTEENLLTAWRTARQQTKYFKAKDG